MNCGFEVVGDRSFPVLMCVPGLMGQPENFSQMIPQWTSQYCVVLVNPEAGNGSGLYGLSAEEMQAVAYYASADVIHDFLSQEFPDADGFYFVGLSLGGKIVFDYAVKFPHFFKGAVVVDAGLSSFEKSEIYKVTNDIHNNLNLNQEWPAIKAELKEKLPEKNLRVLVQTQVIYPDKKPPARWKKGMEFFSRMLGEGSISEQFEPYSKVDAFLASQNRIVRVLHAARLSSICEPSYQQMKKLKSLAMIETENTSHFMFATHIPMVVNEVLNLLPSSKSDSVFAAKQA
ncbi:MAG: alpha/beta fold hydrolase [Pseudobdellovibrionaceae bacterium]